MTHRTAICVLLVGVVVGATLACGENETGEDVHRPTASTSSSAPPVASAPPAYNGVSSLEERILGSDVVAKVRLVSAKAVASTAAWSDNAPDETSPAAVWEFRFRVLEHLKGTSANEITAVVLVRGRSDDTKEEVNHALPTITAERDTQWDSREAIVFLKNSDVAVPNTSQEGHYFMGFRTAPATNEDGYTIASRWDRLWLPDASAASSAVSSGDQRFLLETPSGSGTSSTGSSGSARTISLSDMKSKIATLNTELNGGDGSDAYKECVKSKYQLLRQDQHLAQKKPGSSIYSRRPGHEVASGKPTGTVIDRDEWGFGHPPNQTGKYWLDGVSFEFFGVDTANITPFDVDSDGTNESIRYDHRIVTNRPLPKGIYKFHYNEVWYSMIICNGHHIRYEKTVTVTAPTGTLHELFFDPVTVGAAIGADASDGVLKPTSFTDANNASATLQRIAWVENTVEMMPSPNTGLANHVVDFIALDGKVILSLDADDATVDAANNTLSWPVTDPPWEEGDMLMLRIHDGS